MFMKKFFPLFAFVLLLGAGCSITPVPKPIACTEEAKLCPDGSYVGRTGPNCEFSPCPAKTTGKYQAFSKLGVTITPLEVMQDSRCPRGAECVWAGTVELKARLDSARESKEEVLKLGTPVAFDGKQVELTGVAPVKELDKTISPDEYRFTFSVTASAAVFCTMEAKQCPDGSYVGRKGPNCEFTPCPGALEPPSPNLQSGIEGTITIGPTCPVERIPPDPNCADKPYQAAIKVQTADGQKTITQFTSGADGTFKVYLPPGNYLLVPVNSGMLPRAGEQTVRVEKNAFTKVTITFDSGIR